jgi:hypothetical protein
VVVIFYEDLDAVRRVLIERGAAPATRVQPLRVAEDGRFTVVRPA